jgi:hypothetical protein
MVPRQPSVGTKYLPCEFKRQIKSGTNLTPNSGHNHTQLAAGRFFVEFLVKTSFHHISCEMLHQEHDNSLQPHSESD